MESRFSTQEKLLEVSSRAELGTIAWHEGLDKASPAHALIPPSAVDDAFTDSLVAHVDEEDNFPHVSVYTV
jgi:hypothetical protein